jgi:hypothetical protein
MASYVMKFTFTFTTPDAARLSYDLPAVLSDISRAFSDAV